MLKLISSSCLQSRIRRLTPNVVRALRSGTEADSHLLKVLNSLSGFRWRDPNSGGRAFFCSDSSDGSECDQLVEPEDKVAESRADEADSKASAIVSTNPRPEDYLTVLALPLPHKSLFPGFYMPIYVKLWLFIKIMMNLASSYAYLNRIPNYWQLYRKVENDKPLMLVLSSLRMSQRPILVWHLAPKQKNVFDLKGKELFDRLHEVGTLAQIAGITGDQVTIIGHRRLRITEMVSDDPLTVKVDHLKDKPYNKDDDIIKATSFEVISTLRDVLKTSALWRDHVQSYAQHIGDFTLPRLADFGAAISGANKLQCQQVLEELDVYNRLKLTLELVKKEMEISRIQVFFVCTANVVEMIPNPLLDRMEVVTIAGYITDEKMHIARDYLEKNTREACGIKPEQVEVTDAALVDVIENYCREAGIALQLVRQDATVEPAVAQAIEPKEAEVDFDESGQVTAAKRSSEFLKDSNHEQTEETSEVDNEKPDLPADQSQSPANQSTDMEEAKESEGDKDSETIEPTQKVLVDKPNLTDFIGKPVFHAERIYDQTPIGVVMGLAWSALGGSTLYVETSLIEEGEGKGALHLTDQLGDVMKESAQIAHTVARAILLEKEPENPFFANTKVHLHVPAGATPKDGPSAGCTMITSLLSLAMKKPVRKDLAMTGEVTLTKKILPIGGVKEKTIAARRGEGKTIVFPSANRRDFDELAPNVKEGLDVHFVDDYMQIFSLAFGDDRTQNVEKSLKPIGYWDET